MITVAHLLDDFGMGGVTRALTVFDEPELANRGKSQIVPIDPQSLLAPSLKTNLIVDHMALSWRRLVFLVSLRARNPRARIVHVEHSYTRAFEEAQVTNQKRFRKMLNLAMACVDQFVCVSEAQRQWLLCEVGLPAHKLHMINPWSGRFELNAVPDATQRDNRPMKLVAYGRYAPVKNFDKLIVAMRSFDEEEAHLTLFGDGPDRELLECISTTLPHVNVEGPSDQIADKLVDCDAVIAPSHHEAFGLVATEARLAGRAIIVADVDGLPEQVGSAGMATAMKTAREIARAIRAARELPLAQMGLAGRKEVVEQHDQIIAAWSKVFDWAAGKQGSPVGGQTEAEVA